MKKGILLQNLTGEAPGGFALGGLFLLFIGILLYNPYVWRFNGLGEYLFISRGILALFIAALFLFLPEKLRRESGKCGKPFLILWGAFFLFTLFQWIRLPYGSLEELGEMEFFLLLPLVSLIFPEEIRKILCKFFALLGAYQLLVSTYHTPFFEKLFDFSWHHPDWTLFMAGITGNANWTSSLLFLTLPFLLFFLHDLCRKWKVLWWGEGLILLPLVLGGGYFIFRLASIGSCLAFAGSCGVLSYLFLGRSRKYILLGGGIFVLLFSLLFFLPGKSSALYKAGNGEARLQLLLAAVEALREVPLTGFGKEEVVEGALTRNRQEGYFLTDSSATRTNHPHNEIMMRMLLSGIPAGLLFWGFFIILPLWKVGKLLGSSPLPPWKREKKEREKILLFGALLFLIFHGQLDLALFAWPLREFFLLLLGLFWRESFEKEDEKDVPERGPFPIFFKVPLWLAALFLLGLSGFYAHRNFFSMEALRKLNFDKTLSPDTKIKSGKKAALLTPRQALVLQSFMVFCIRERRWNDALFFANRMAFTFQKDYGRIHGFRGQILARLGRFEEAFFAYQKDGELFPLAVLPVYNMIQLARLAGKREFLGILHKELERRKKLMQFTEDDFQAVLRGRHNELHSGIRRKYRY